MKRATYSVRVRLPRLPSGRSVLYSWPVLDAVVRGGQGDARGSGSRINPGRMRSSRWMDGRRDSTYDGRRGVWRAAKPGLLLGLKE